LASLHRLQQEAEIGGATATFVAGISGATVAGGVSVSVDGNGHLGSVVSSRHF